MKVFSDEHEGVRSVLGYRCNACEKYNKGENFPNGWYGDDDYNEYYEWYDGDEEHYCSGCIAECDDCKRVLPPKYLDGGLCIDCRIDRK